MSLAYYLDHHVPRAIAEGLRTRGIDILTAEEDGAAEQADEEILERATALGRIVFTQDHDFLILAHLWADTSREFAGVVYGHQLAITIGQAIRDLEAIAIVMDFAEMWNRVEFLPLK